MRLGVYISSEAKSFLIHLARSNAKLARIFETHINKLPDVYQSDPFLKESTYQGMRKHRVGDYRIIYRVIHSQLLIHVIEIGHRREIYDR